MEKMTFKVEGMVCGKCTARTETVMGKISEITNLQCDLEAKTISLETSLPKDEIVEIIEDLGFDIV